MTKGKYIRTQEILEKLRTPKIIEYRILESYYKNINVRQIAKENNVNVGCIYRILKRNNLNLKGYNLRVRTENQNKKVSIASKKSWKNPIVRKKRINGLKKVRKQINISRKITFGTYGETKEEEQKRYNQYKNEWKNNNYEKSRKIKENYRINNPKKIKAQRIAERHIKIYENQLCEKCNKNKAKHRHHNDYDKPLKVNLLCVSCHNKIPKEY